MNINNSSEQDMIKKAYDYAAKAHAGQFDKGGKPYIEHVKHVADRINGDNNAKIVALLHDVVEDTDYTFEDIAAEGFEDCILEALRIITKNTDIEYMEYIDNISSNELACKVKIVDLKHNMDLTRIPNPTDYDYRRIEKYKKALEYLEKNIKKTDGEDIQ